MVEDFDKNMEPLAEFIVNESFSLAKNSIKYFLGIDRENIPEEITKEFIDNVSHSVIKFIKSLKE